MFPNGINPKACCFKGEDGAQTPSYLKLPTQNNNGVVWEMIFAQYFFSPSAQSSFVSMIEQIKEPEAKI